MTTKMASSSVNKMKLGLFGLVDCRITISEKLEEINFANVSNNTMPTDAMVKLAQFQIVLTIYAFF